MNRKLFSAIRLRWRLVSLVLAVVIPLSTPTYKLEAAVAAESAINPNVQQPLLSPPVEILEAARSLPAEKIEPRRTIPEMAPLPAKEIAAFTEDDDFFRGHVFSEPLVAKKGNANLKENKSLALAMSGFAKRVKSNDFSDVENFIESNPGSRWSISLLANLANSYFKEGYFTKALSTWEKVWELGRNETDSDLKLIVDRAVAELAKMNARLGRFDRMESLFKEVGNRELRGSATEIMVGAKDALWLMKNRPEESFRCGPMALGSVLALSKGKTGVDQQVERFKSTSQGTSLAQLADWSKELGLNYQIAKRAVGASIITPCIVHWKVGHYASLVNNDNGVVHVQDPTFAEDLWIRAEALDSEVSGYFLVPAGPLPEGWISVKWAEAKEVWGKGQTGGNDPDRCDPCDKKAKGGCGTCPAMAQYDVHALLVSLNITDTPVFYNVAVGPSADFTLTYNQREAAQPVTFDYANFGNKWTCNVVSYITDDSSYLSADAKVYVQGGGVRTFKNFNSNTNSYASEYRTQAVLVRTSSNPISYELRNTDGSKQIFSMPNSTIGAGRKVFLTQTVDAVGNAITYIYSGQRIIAITDAKGLVTSIEYKSNTTNSPDYYRIGKVTNPFGKFATFDYNANGQLFVITDMIGIFSAFEYSGDFINKLTTPYGATTFAYGDASNLTPAPPDQMRWLEITDPLGAKERVEYRHNAPGIPVTEASPPSMPYPGATDSYLYYRNTFFWNKKAMLEAPGDYTKAKITHWLHTSSGQASGTVESEKVPLEGRVYNVYKDQSNSIVDGPNELLIAQGRKLDDGTDQVTQYEYNTLGNKTKEIDPLGRTTNTIYDTNGIDVLEINQTVGATTQVLTSYRNADGSSSYNAQRRPLRRIDAAGQVTTFTYNSNGQVLTTSQVRNGQTETTTRTYVTSTAENGYGQVKTITGPLVGATATYTYDALSRVQSVTDSANYTLTYEYDALNRVAKVSFPDGTYEQTLYKWLDAEWKRDRLGRWSRTQHDALQRPTLMTDAEQRTTEYQWCACGSLNAIVDASLNKTSFYYDIQSRLTQKTYADNTSLLYKYETSTSRLKRVTDAKNQVSNYNYNKDNTLESVTYTDNSTPTGALAGVVLTSTPKVSYTYDPNYNRVATMVDGTGTTSYGYYPISTTPTLGAGRLQYEDGPITGDNDKRVHTYDEYGRELSCAINGVADVRTYDALGRVATATNPLGAFTYGYVGTTPRLDFVSYPNGQKTSYAYYGNTGDNRLQQIKNLPTAGAATPISQFDYSYNAVGNITGWQQNNSGAANPVQSALAYDRADQLSGAALTNATSGAAVKQYGYWYDKAGNRTDEQIDNTVSSASHNNLNQLTARSGSSGKMSFEGYLNESGTVTVGGVAATVDGNNKWKASVTVAPGTNTVPIVATDVNGNVTNKQAQLSVTSGTASQALAYDLNGNITNDGTRSFEWDAVNRMTAINYTGTDPAQRTEFTYNGIGQRVKQIEKSGTTITSEKRMLWCKMDLREERNASDVVTKLYYKQGMVTGSTVPAANISKFYYTRDHLGSIREMTDSTAGVRARYDYDPYGRRTKLSGDMDCDFGYTGHYFHTASNLQLSYYRAYDANFARWLSRDPIDNAEKNLGPNLYAYVLDNPVNYLDPDGRKPELPTPPPRPCQEGQRTDPRNWTCDPPAGIFNACPRTKSCCIEHDYCYWVNNCNADSWWPWCGTSSCHTCNKKVAKCIASGGLDAPRAQPNI